MRRLNILPTWNDKESENEDVLRTKEGQSFLHSSVRVICYMADVISIILYYYNYLSFMLIDEEPNVNHVL